MKKNILFLLIVGIAPALFAQSDYKVIDNANYVAAYQYKHKEDSTSNNLQTVNMHLRIGRDISIFQACGRTFMDSTIANIENSNTQTLNAPININMSSKSKITEFSKYRIIKANGDNREINLYERIDDTTVKIPFDSKFEWKLSPEDTTILSYKCKRATLNYAGRSYVAWYTMQVPISDGPYIFSGLPGLILHMADTKGEHVFGLIQLTKNSKATPMLFPERNYIEITTKQYIQAKNDEKTRRIKKFFNPKYLPNTSPEQMSAAEKRILSRNNYIEKEY